MNTKWNATQRGRAPWATRAGLRSIFLTALLAVLAGGLTACAKDSLIVHDPYEGVDWERVEQHQNEFHAHRRVWHPAGTAEAADVIDVYLDLGRTVFNASAEAEDEPAYYPWQELDERHEDWTETRDPEEAGVVTFPVTEMDDLEHVNALFSTIRPQDAEYDDWQGKVEAIITSDEHAVFDKGLAILAHPGRYYTDPDEAYTEYRDAFARSSREDGLLGFEALNKEWQPERGAMQRHDDVRLLDNILTDLAPERMVWGFAADDPNGFIPGQTYDLRWNTLLLPPEEFDPSDQRGSQWAAFDAFVAGRTFYHERVQWDPAEETPADPPTIHAIEVEHNSITITASGYDRIFWISRGEVVAEGETIALTPEHAPYVRAEVILEGRDAETYTQAWGIAP